MDTEGMGSAIFVGLIVTAGCMLISAQTQILILWMFGPLLGGIIAGILTKNGSKCVLAGLLSGIFGSFVFIIGMLISYPPPKEMRNDWEFLTFVASIVAVYAGFVWGSIGGVVGGMGSEMAKTKSVLKTGRAWTGKIAFALALFSIGCGGVSLSILGYGEWVIIEVLTYVSALAALILGVHAWRKNKDKFGPMALILVLLFILNLS